MLETFPLLSQYSDLILLIVRLIAGTTMIYYGRLKVRDLKKNAEDFNGMGFRPGWLWGTAVALNEFFGGFAVIAGIYIWIPALLFAIQMIGGALWKITNTEKSFRNWSYDLLLLSIMLLLLTFGAGNFSIIG